MHAAAALPSKRNPPSESLFWVSFLGLDPNAEPPELRVRAFFFWFEYLHVAEFPGIKPLESLLLLRLILKKDGA